MININDKILITGANGFLGCHIIRALLANGFCNVYACIRDGGNQWRLEAELLSSTVELVELDITREENISTVIQQVRPKVVVNCASYGVNPDHLDPERTVQTNLYGSYTLLENSERFGVEQFVQVGSCFEYGQKESPILETDSLSPTAMYGATKACASILLERRAKDLGISLLILRVFGLWGELEDNYRLVPLIVRACLKHEPLPLTAGEQIRDYSYVGDVAHIIVQLLLTDRKADQDIINIASGSPVRLKEFILQVASELKCTDLMRFGDLQYRDSEMWSLVANIEKLRNLGVIIPRTPIKVGVQRMLKSNQRQKNQSSIQVYVT